jgi:hypothetical protein
MFKIRIEADAMHRAVAAHDYKLLAHFLDLRTGEITSRVLSPEEAKDAPMGPRVQPLPVMGGSLERKKDDPWLAPRSSPSGKKPLFKQDEGTRKKDPFAGDFWKRDSIDRPNLFGDKGFKGVSSSKKLAELFAEGPGKKGPRQDPISQGASPRNAVPAPAFFPIPPEEKPPPSQDSDDPLQRIPVASEEQHLDWMKAFAKDCGDPDIREKLLKCFVAAHPFKGFFGVLKSYQRMSQQWDRYYRRQTLHYAAEWLKSLPIFWEIRDDERPMP